MVLSYRMGRTKLVVGIDGGGTKTYLVVSDLNGKIIGLHKTGNGNVLNPRTH